MSRTFQIAQVGKRELELSNLKKVLYPDSHILKAELIEYYLKVAPTILSHLRGRPLSLIRYPEGIDGKRFFQKNRPEWAPGWIEHVTLRESDGKEKIDYVLATEEASLVWLANLACIELHQMHCRSPHFDKPDYFVFDLDPPENYRFKELVQMALDMKEHLESFGYTPFVKTSGSKGLHILVPIEPKWTFDKVFEAVQEVARIFVDSHSRSATLHIKKEARKGRGLVDIYRNRTYQTIVSAYRVRGLPGAPVSMPLRWDQLADTGSAADFNLHNVPGLVVHNGDAWEEIAAYAAVLHTAGKGTTTKKETAPSHRHKTPQLLGEYAKKRSFGKTPEPPPAVTAGEGDAFVLHRHHATRLHYDLRLERGGVLKSWAVPKGLPPRPGIMRLAVPTEDHPLEYMNFEGSIPKGQYGGGEVWIFARGKYEITKEKKDGFYFRLQSRELSSEYRMHRTGENKWMLERLDPPQVDWLRGPVEPMLARPADAPPHGDYLYEVKWDGIRAMVALDEGEVRIWSRNRHDITSRFPEFLVPDRAFRTTSALFDAEIVCLDEEGKPVFSNVIQRIRQNGKGAIDRARVRHPAVCYVFDCLCLDGRAAAALRETGKVGIGKVVLHDREDLVMIAPYENAVVLYKLRTPREIRNVNEIPQLDGKPLTGEWLKLARDLIASMSTTMDKLDLTDKYHDALRAVIEAKIAGKDIVTVEKEEKPVVDIMTALKLSIERAKSNKKPMEKATGKKKTVVSKEAKAGSRERG